MNYSVVGCHPQIHAKSLQSILEQFLCQKKTKTKKQKTYDTFPSTIASNEIKYQGINLTKK